MTETFGYTFAPIGYNAAIYLDDKINANMNSNDPQDIMSPDYDGTANCIKAYVKVETEDHDIKGAIYEHVGGLFGNTLISNGTTEKNNYATGTHLIELEFTTSPTIYSSKMYTVSVWAEDANGTAQIGYQLSMGNTYQLVQNRSFNGWPSSYNGSSGIGNIVNCIYVEYELLPTAEMTPGKGYVSWTP